MSAPVLGVANEYLESSLLEVQFLEPDVGLQQCPIARLAELEVGVDDAGDHIHELKVAAVAAVDRSRFEKRLRTDTEPKLCLQIVVEAATAAGWYRALVWSK